MKGSLLLILLFLSGIVLAYTNILPAQWVTHYNMTHWALLALIFCVGFTIGSDREIWQKFKNLDRRVIILPLLTMIGTLSGGLCASTLLPYSTSDTLAISSGYAYYSLSSIIITDYRGAELGTIALLCNIFRELFVLLLAPILVRYFGKLALISAGGATTMDTTLPIITRYCGRDIAILSVFHAFVVDLSVPFWVTFFCTL